MGAPLPTDVEKLVAELRRAVMNGEDGCGTLPAKESVKVRPQDWHRITRLAREAATLIESQLATIERVERERDEQAQLVINEMIYEARCDAEVRAAGARVTALEAEKAGLVRAAQCALGHLTGNMDGDMDLGDPVELLRASLSSTEKTDER